MWDGTWIEFLHKDPDNGAFTPLSDVHWAPAFSSSRVCMFFVSLTPFMHFWQLDQIRSDLLQERAAKQDLECDKIALERQVGLPPCGTTGARRRTPVFSTVMPHRLSTGVLLHLQTDTEQGLQEQGGSSGSFSEIQQGGHGAPAGRAGPGAGAEAGGGGAVGPWGRQRVRACIGSLPHLLFPLHRLRADDG